MFCPELTFPRKNKISKEPVKNGHKGNGDGKKAGSKPKDGAV